MPHADGVFLRDDPQKLVLEGSVADVPFVIGEWPSEWKVYTRTALIASARVERGRRHSVHASIAESHV